MTGPQGEETPWWQQMRRPTPAPPHYAPPQYTPQYAPQYAPQPPSQPRHSARWLLVGGGVLVGAIAAVVVALALLRFGAFGGQVLNVSKAEQSVKQVITDPVTGYGVAGVTDVKCNNGENPTAKKGDSFTCEVTIAGKKHQVRAVFIDDNGTYEVDRPR